MSDLNSEVGVNMQRWAAFVLLLAIVTGCRTPEIESEVLDADDDAGRLGVVGFTKVEGKELSGMTYRSGGGNGIELLVVSDSSYKLFSVNFKAGLAADTYYYDLKDVIPDEFRDSKSQFEAVAATKSHVLILRENPGNIFVFSRDLGSFVQAITLKVPKTHEIYDDWKGDPNSRGEGMILLKNGHILVVKEKSPVQLIEFGPKNAAPAGYQPGDALNPDEVFPLSSGTKIDFYPLKVWDIGNSSEHLLNDVSELAVGPDGKIYALSDQSARIALIESGLTPTEGKFKVKSTWKLSKKVSKPEGLVITSQFEPLVTSDMADIGKNLFHLKPLN
jgi:hypothetical protein